MSWTDVQEQKAEMKRETLRHPKTYDLAARLGIGRDTAIGKLTLLWDYCGEVAPRGDIGKWSDAVIAQACEWTAEPSIFVTALLESGWLDRSESSRLVIHDWPDHCEDWVRAKLKRANTLFCDEYHRPNDVGVYKRHCSDTVATAERLSNPIQSKGLSMSKGEADDDADNLEISDDDWESVVCEVKRIAKVAPIKSTEDRDLLFKIAVLHRRKMSEGWLSSPLGVLRNKKRVRNRVAYLHSALKANCAKNGIDFNRLLSRVVIPPEVLQPQAAAT